MSNLIADVPNGREARPELQRKQPSDDSINYNIHYQDGQLTWLEGNSATPLDMAASST